MAARPNVDEVRLFRSAGTTPRENFSPTDFPFRQNWTLLPTDISKH